MKLYEMLKNPADEEQLLLHPLPEHAAANEAEHLRRHYALLLAALLTAQPAVSDGQSRLFRLLLDALKLGDLRGALFEAARQLEAETLLEAVRLLREKEYAKALLVDGLVLLRLDAPLDDEACALIAELAAILDVNADELANLAKIAAFILGASEEEDNAEPFSCASLIAESWPNALPQTLSADDLRAGISGGLWLVDEKIDADFPWQAEEATLLFTERGEIHTFFRGQNNPVATLRDCRLIDARLGFRGRGEVKVARCAWQGRFDPAAQATALTVEGGSLELTECTFATTNARAILFSSWRAILFSSGGDCTIEDSRFTGCGHPELEGGAICSDGAIHVVRCRFERCEAARGGAIDCKSLNEESVRDCIFESCASLQLRVRDIAVYARSEMSDRAVVACVFRNTSLAIMEDHFLSNPFGLFGSANTSSRGFAFVTDCIFENGNLYHQIDEKHTIQRGCRFVGGECLRENL